MKKILLLFMAFTLSTPFSNAQDFGEYCSANTPKKTAGGILLSTSGVNFLSKNIIEHQITKKLKQELNSDFDINIDNFYGVNIFSGKFKGLTATSKQMNYDGFYLSNIKAQTLCDYNAVSYKDDKLKFEENMILKYTSTITQDDLNKTLASKEYKKVIEKMNQDKLLSSIFKIETFNAQIKDNNIVLKYKINPIPKLNSPVLKNIFKPINISLGGNLKAEDGKIQLCNLQLNSKKINTIPLSAINALNPLEYDVDMSKDKRGNLSVENINIKDNKILIDGYITILKD